jgi:hypothetical protein
MTLFQQGNTVSNNKLILHVALYYNSMGQLDGSVDYHWKKRV